MLVQVMTRILFIEDGPKAQETLKMVLADSYQVTSAFTGEQGIEIVREENPDIVLLDINLPDLDGLEVLEQIMAIPAPPPVVILTASQIRHRNHLFISTHSIPRTFIA